METRYVNEFGTVIPSHIVKKAKDMGCCKPAYIYKDKEWINHETVPKSNINSIKFIPEDIIDENKVSLGDGWVVFKDTNGLGRLAYVWSRE